MFRTLCLEHVNDVHEVSVPGSKPDEVIKVPLFTSDLSPVIEGRFVNNEAVFFGPEKGPDGKPVPVARGPLAKANRQLFLFIPSQGREGKPAYEVKAYDDDTGSFAMGSVRAINLSPVPVRFVVSGSPSPQIPAAKFAQFSHPKKVDEYNMFPVAVEFLSGDGKWVTGQSASWKATDRRRDIVVTLVNSKFKLPEVRMYSDFPPWLETQAAQP